MSIVEDREEAKSGSEQPAHPKCFRCGETNPDEFHKNTARVSGYQGYCKPCFAGYKRRQLTPAPTVYSTQAAKVSEFVKSFWLKHNRPPTVCDITQGCRFSSTSVAVYWCKRMRARGDLLWEDGSGNYRLPNMRVVFE